MDAPGKPEDLYTIRSMRSDEAGFLKQMLFEAIYLPPEEKKNLPREIVMHPDLLIYWQDWGREGDMSLIAEMKNDARLLGCAWGRMFQADKPGYGFVSECIPELSVAVVPEFQNKGIGTLLIRKLLSSYRKYGVTIVSLSVSKNNRSVNLYTRVGFQVISGRKDDYVMTCCLTG